MDAGCEDVADVADVVAIKCSIYSTSFGQLDFGFIERILHDFTIPRLETKVHAVSSVIGRKSKQQIINIDNSRFYVVCI